MNTAPSKIGPYAVEREIGRGGMGVVYLGRDERLGRRVAIKALPEASADSAEFVARFDREGRVLASLNHPNVASIYGIEDGAGGTRFLVMEFVEGETLATLLRQREGTGLPVDEALTIASQIAAGVEAAHEAGVVHRDLKPGNVIVAPNGRAKVLDFGLAKGGADPVSSTGLRRSDPESPTATIASRAVGAHSPVTMPGRIMGSAGYLSPEQARGKSLDRRTDIFSFGCVLFECLTGKMAFGGETLSDTIAATLEREPRWELLPANTPPRVRDLLARCLEKDQSRRLRDIGDARLEIEKAINGREWSSSFIASHSHIGTPVTTRHGGSRAVAWLALGLIVGGAAVATAMMMKPAQGTIQPHVEPRYFSIAVPNQMEAHFGTISPDGETVAFVSSPKSNAESGQAAGTESDRRRLFLRPLRSAQARQVSDSASVSDVCFSPDSRWFVYVSRTSGPQPTYRLVKAPVAGDSPAVSLTSGDDISQINSLAWLADGTIVAASGPKGLRLFRSADGHVVREVALQGVGTNAGVTNLSPLGTNDWVLGTVFAYAERGYDVSAAAVNLKSGEVKVLVAKGGAPVWIGGSRLFFTRGDQLLVTDFDPATLATSGEVRALASGLRASSLWDHADLTISNNGTALFVPGGVTGSDRRVMLGNPDGSSEPWCEDVRPFVSMGDLSGDASRALIIVGAPSGLFELWVSQARKAPFRRLASFPAQDVAAACFLPGADDVFFGAFGRDLTANALYRQSISGGTLPVRLAGIAYNWCVSAEPIGPSTTDDLIVMPAETDRSDVARLRLTEARDGEAKPETLIRGEPNAGFGTPSPDGRFIAYIRLEQGRVTLMVSPLGPNGVSGSPAVLSSSEQELLPLGWYTTETENSFGVFWTTSRTIEYQPIDKVKGVPSGTRRSVPRPAERIDVVALSGTPEGRYLFVQRGSDEEFPGTMSLITDLPAMITDSTKKNDQRP
ncbi:MAG: serine/threonine protein kinase [Phycisphaerae bacterium]|nr:serine/threonine protein kinase [Phycisphaerae bacterium]